MVAITFENSSEPTAISERLVTFLDYEDLSQAVEDNRTFANESGVYVSDDYYDHEWRANFMLSRPYNIMMLILGMVAIIANIIGLIGIMQVKGGSSPRLRLIVSLGCSDILCALSNVLYIIMRILIPTHGNSDPSWCVTEICKVLLYTAYNATLLNLLGMAIDHYLAIMRPLHYATLMSKKRASIMISVFWVISIIFGFSDFIISLFYHKHMWDYVYCKFLETTVYEEPFAIYFLALVCYGTMLYVYLRIYQEVCKHQRRAPANSEFHRNKKGLVTTLLILGTFFACWLPTVLVEIIPLIQAHVGGYKYQDMMKIVRAQQYVNLLPVVNAICDPIIYMTRTAEIRQSCRNWSRQWVSRRCNRSSSVLEFNGTSYAMISNGRGRCFSNASLSRNTMETSA